MKNMFEQNPDIIILLTSIVGGIVIAFGVFYGTKIKTIQSKKEIKELKTDLKIAEETIKQKQSENFELTNQVLNFTNLIQENQVIIKANQEKLKLVSSYVKEQIKKESEKLDFGEHTISIGANYNILDKNDKNTLNNLLLNNQNRENHYDLSIWQRNGAKARIKLIGKWKAFGRQKTTDYEPNGFIYNAPEDRVQIHAATIHIINSTGNFINTENLYFEFEKTGLPFPFENCNIILQNSNGVEFKGEIDHINGSLISGFFILTN